MGIPQGETHSGFVAADIKKLFEQAKVGRNAKEAFTEGDENGEMKKGVGGQLRELYPVGEKEATQEWMKRKLEPAKEIIKKNNTPPRRRIWEYLGSWCKNSVFGDNPRFLQAANLTIRDLRAGPREGLWLRRATGGIGGGRF